MPMLPKEMSVIMTVGVPSCATMAPRAFFVVLCRAHRADTQIGQVYTAKFPTTLVGLTAL